MVQDERLAGLIDIAIEREEQAYAFYTGLLDKIQDKEVRNAVSFIAEEEKRHRRFLVDYRDGKYGSAALRMTEPVFYRIAEYQKEPEVKKTMSSADVFLVAAHREQRSHQFYTGLAELHEGTAKDIYLRMASEELRHKEKMEYLYSNVAFPQTDGG